MLDVFAQPAFWTSLVLLVGMEVVLSADNFVFIAAMAAKIPSEHRRKVLRVALALAALFRLLLLFGVVWVMGLQRTAFAIAGWAPSWRELVLLAGGLFLIYKAVIELYLLIEPAPAAPVEPMRISESLTIGVLQIVLINAVFSVDSIITAIGLTPYVEAMAIAVVVSVGFLYFAASRLGDIIAAHPSVKALALGFLLVVGMALVADGLGFSVMRPYFYGAMIFAILVLAAAKLVRSILGTKRVVEAANGGQIEPRFDPAPVFVPVEPAFEDPVPAPEIAEELHPEPREEDAPLPTVDVDADEPDQPDRDDETLGGQERAVPKSPTKRSGRRNRVMRPRTGRRRE
ncbi:TerC family protein [Pelagibacterium lacus]|nr:TerC family protein [Pelagibacterium lacus]